MSSTTNPPHLIHLSKSYLSYSIPRATSNKQVFRNQ